MKQEVHSQTSSTGVYTKDKHLHLYGRAVLLIALSLFVLFTFVYVIVSLNDKNLPSWLAAITNFIASLYPNVFILPVTFLCTALFLGPLREKEQEHNEDRLLKRIENSLIPKFYESTLHAYTTVTAITQLGIVEILDHFDYTVLGNRIALAEKRIFILENWICQNLYEYEEAFHQAAQKDVSIQVVLLNPDSEFARQRSRDLGHDEKYVPDQIRANITVLKILRKKLKLEKLQVKYHTSLPSLQIFICDNNAFVGFYLHRIDSQYAPQLDVLIKNEKQEYTKFGKRIDSEFNDVWEDATNALDTDE